MARGPTRRPTLSQIIDEGALARLFVRHVLTAPATVLLQLQALPGIALALRRHVVPPLALLASERDRRSLVTSHSSVSSLQSPVSSPPPAVGPATGDWRLATPST